MVAHSSPVLRMYTNVISHFAYPKVGGGGTFRKLHTAILSPLP